MDEEKAPSMRDYGKLSIIKLYCEQAMLAKGRHSDCIWVCIKRARRWVAKDVQLSERPMGVFELRKLCGWWKQHSLFSAVGLREVKIRFLGFNKSIQEVEVVVKDFGHSNVESDLDRNIAEALKVKDHPFECKVDIMGVRHPADSDYPDRINYRKIQRVDDLCRLKEESRWLPAMLDYYWQNGFGSKGVRFLESAEFIQKYSDLRYDTYEDAANPCGKSINAFELVEGWRIKYLLCMVLAALMLSICVVAASTTVTQNFEAGLTAGSYALGLATVTLAVLTFLSAIL